MTDDFYLSVELYKRGLFDLISFTDKVTGEPFAFHKKQVQALEYLNDNITTYVGFGGSARGGKSALISIDAILSAYAFPKSVNLIGRKNLTILWETTWQTFLRVLNNFGFVDKVDYRWHDNRHEMTFLENNSMVIAKNLELKPTDKEATEYGSLEIMKAYIDQSEHVPLKIIEKIGERVGSHYTSMEYGVKGKVLEAFNPSPNHTKSRYWVPFNSGQEKETRKFVQSLPSDNPGKEAKEWVEQKKKDYLDGTMSELEYKKQILGDFNFDEDPTALLNYQDISNIWQNSHVNMNHFDKYIVADIARFGSDKAIVTVWYGWVLWEYYVFDVSSTVLIQNCINAMRNKHQISANRCLGDEDGVGGGVIDNCKIIGFKNGGKPSNPAYQNLKTECSYKLAEIIQQIYFQAEVTEEIKQRVEQELSQLKTYDADKDGKLRILPKEKIKENIGRSPDWLDVFIMRCYFVIFNPVQMNRALQDALKYVG